MDKTVSNSLQHHPPHNKNNNNNGSKNIIFSPLLFTTNDSRNFCHPSTSNTWQNLLSVRLNHPHPTPSPIPNQTPTITTPNNDDAHCYTFIKILSSPKSNSDNKNDKAHHNEPLKVLPKLNRTPTKLQKTDQKTNMTELNSSAAKKNYKITCVCLPIFCLKRTNFSILSKNQSEDKKNQLITERQYLLPKTCKTKLAFSLTCIHLIWLGKKQD